MMTETVVNVEPNRGVAPQPHVDPNANSGTGSVRINFRYFISIPGILKIVQVIFGIICMACATPALVGSTRFFLFVIIVAFIGTVLWCFAYLLSLREAINLSINWVLTEIINTALIVILYFIGFVVQLAAWSGTTGYWGTHKGSNIAAGVFGLFNFLAYSAGLYLLFLESKQHNT